MWPLHTAADSVEVHSLTLHLTFSPRRIKGVYCWTSAAMRRMTGKSQNTKQLSFWPFSAWCVMSHWAWKNSVCIQDHWNDEDFVTCKIDRQKNLQHGFLPSAVKLKNHLFARLIFLSSPAKPCIFVVCVLMPCIVVGSHSFQCIVNSIIILRFQVALKWWLGFICGFLLSILFWLSAGPLGIHLWFFAVQTVLIISWTSWTSCNNE